MKNRCILAGILARSILVPAAGARADDMPPITSPKPGAFKLAPTQILHLNLGRMLFHTGFLYLKAWFI